MAESKVEMNVYAQLTKSPKHIAPTKITSVNLTVDDNVIRAVDTYYDTLESARQALLDTLYQKGFEVFLGGAWAQKAIKRITRKMAILRLKREQMFHNWSADDVMEYAPYWKELITPGRLGIFCSANKQQIKDFFTAHNTIDVEKKTSVYDIIRFRNNNVNSTHHDNLESHIESVVNAYVDTFAIDELTMFLNNIYHEMLRKTPTNAPVDINVGVDVDADIDYVIQTVRHIMQKRENEARKTEQERLNAEKLKRTNKGLEKLKEKKRREEQRKRQRTRRSRNSTANATKKKVQPQGETTKANQGERKVGNTKQTKRRGRGRPKGRQGL